MRPEACQPRRGALTSASRTQYYTGEAVAPYPTLFIGGNHEACNYLWEARRSSGVRHHGVP